jgi:hypothetical protein
MRSVSMRAAIMSYKLIPSRSQPLWHISQDYERSMNGPLKEMKCIAQLQTRYMMILGFECIICGDFKRDDQARPVTADCAHKINACKDDIARMIEVDVSQGKLDLFCPDTSCRAKLSIVDVRAFASSTVYEK